LYIQKKQPGWIFWDDRENNNTLPQGRYRCHIKIDETEFEESIYLIIDNASICPCINSDDDLAYDPVVEKKLRIKSLQTL